MKYIKEDNHFPWKETRYLKGEIMIRVIYDDTHFAFVYQCIEGNVSLLHPTVKIPYEIEFESYLIRMGLLV